METHVDITNRKALMLNILKKADEDKRVKEQIEMLRRMTQGDNLDRLKQDESISSLFKEEDPSEEESLSSQKNPEASQSDLSEEAKEIVLKYGKLYEDINSGAVGAYVYGPLQRLGDAVWEHTGQHLVDGVSDLVEWAKDEGHSVPADSAEQGKNLLSQGNINDNLSIIKYSIDLMSDDRIQKTAARKAIFNKVSKAIEEELTLSVSNFGNYFEGYKDIDLKTYNKLYPLAAAHHILTKEGSLKEAGYIDNFVLKSAGLWDDFVDGAKSVGSAISSGIESTWESTKNVVSIGLEAASDGINAAKRGLSYIATKSFTALKLLVTNMPVLGVIISAPIAVKNIIESYRNGKRILFELNLKKFGYEPSKCIVPALSAPHVFPTYKAALQEFRENPDDLRELIIIHKTIGSFYVDVILAITNIMMAIFDICFLVGLWFSWAGGWIISLGALGARWLIAIGVGVIEASSVLLQSSYWKDHDRLMLKVIEQELSKFEAGKRTI